MNTTADKTSQFCLLSTHFPISKFLLFLNIFETEQLQIGNWVETRQNSRAPKNVALGYDIGKISAGCVVVFSITEKTSISDCCAFAHKFEWKWNKETVRSVGVELCFFR